MPDTNRHFTQTRNALLAWRDNSRLAPGVSGLFEGHVFCTPLDPSHEEKERFVAVCEQIGIKPLCLGLDYVGKGVVSVLQTTRYHETADVPASVEFMLHEAEALQEHFEVVRLKLEAMAENRGVPQTDREAEQVPGDTYFEYHIKVDGPVSPENDERLKVLARDLTDELGVKVPFSCNNMRDKTQRYLNLRTYRIGYASSAAVVQRAVEAIARHGFTPAKVIREFIVYDTNKDLDRGWLEF
jgi:hypothetical protein